jgi:hypothetical protein
MINANNNETFRSAALASRAIAQSLNAIRQGKASRMIGFHGGRNAGTGRLWVHEGNASESGFATWSGAETKTNNIDTSVLPRFEKIALNAPGVFALRRTDLPGRNVYAMTGNQAFTCGEDYALDGMQPADLLDMPENIADLVKPMTIGYFRNGELSYRSDLINTFEPVPGDVTRQYYTRGVCYNGTMTGERHGISQTAMECSNTFTHAMQDCNFKNKRTKNALSRSAELRDRVAQKIAEAAGFAEFTKALTKSDMSDNQWETLKDFYAPRKFDAKGEDVTGTRATNVRNELDQILFESPGQENRLSHTGMSLYVGLNALTYYASHVVGTRVTGSKGMDDSQRDALAQQNRLESVMFGRGAQTQAKVQQQLVRWVQAA